MSWADRTPPSMPSVDMPDVAPWERDEEIERECAFFEYDDRAEPVNCEAGLGHLPDAEAATADTGERCLGTASGEAKPEHAQKSRMPAAPMNSSTAGREASSQRRHTGIDYDHQAALAGSLT